ncbi:hypothetical protein RB623_21775 [Mesorhizobium sp. LHD-90]|uniref:hypothetical protein n=1 Tax=Mesorhizobium sp. LHD-90 TaxID=3071414 RepID=UPI0027E186CA|nr:hypothetical protein [Mesorhizobium sp. LHD-90]MDQ6436688.1 hypothetical protein [Mesorhizobium sp. LHD-90]
MTNDVVWTLLITAGLLDAAWAVSMKYADGRKACGGHRRSQLTCGTRPLSFVQFARLYFEDRNILVIDAA